MLHSEDHNYRRNSRQANVEKTLPDLASMPRPLLSTCSWVTSRHIQSARRFQATSQRAPPPLTSRVLTTSLFGSTTMASANQNWALDTYGPKVVADGTSPTHRHANRRWRVHFGCLTVAFIIILACRTIVDGSTTRELDSFGLFAPLWRLLSGVSSRSDYELCPQVPPIEPKVHSELAGILDRTTASDEFRSWAYKVHGGAVKIPTVTYDDLGSPEEDPRWGSRTLYHDYLEEKFPLAHETLTRTVVNHFALAFHWQGRNASLKPILLTGHQDTVPVDPETEDEWTHPPFSGHYDGEWIWGRGSVDDKSTVNGLLSAVETLLHAGFQPERTVVLGFGMDEERGGIAGGPAMRDHLLGTYGRNGFSMLVDEGYTFGEHDGVMIAQPGIAEKGMTQVRIEVTTPGGHSMLPPPHTSIGFLSTIVHTLERNPPPLQLTRTGPVFRALGCDPKYSSLVRRAATNDGALAQLQERLMKEDPTARALLGTTQAVDVVGGGIKINALPGSAWAMVDHRIADWSSVEDVKSRYVALLAPLAEELNLTLDAFGSGSEGATRPSSGHVQVSVGYGLEFESSPVTVTGPESKPWTLLSGTILSTFESAPGSPHAGKPKIVAPALVLDTRHYWALTPHIFRYVHIDHRDLHGASHSVNEAIRAKGYIEMIRFYARLILNADEADLEDAVETYD
ncbi:Zn-dependent exopeptidase [Artomyces pyxidatus]|uniref:Zn-dependent exopeptidase n=1 Tax=Artomyces pyxidatus TaxID=48021 RepID=A0ACB8SKL6_9AGAM|nr:Zn-dependent exopeptidase [Artomyces pyxidatus]